MLKKDFAAWHFRLSLDTANLAIQVCDMQRMSLEARQAKSIREVVRSARREVDHMGATRFLFTNKAMCFVVAVTALFSTPTALAEVRIVALGDGEIRGRGVLESQAYPAQLEPR